MDKTIHVKNCKCINDASIKVVEHALNIKYGCNGTGKSTISEAISVGVSGKAWPQDIIPYGSDESAVPEVETDGFNSVMVFDEEYINRFLIKGDGFYEDPYRVLLRSPECEELAHEIDEKLSDLQGMFQESGEIQELKNLLPEYIKAVSFSDGRVSKRGGVGEFVKGNGGGFEKYAELDTYKPFYERDLPVVASWAQWRNAGIDQMRGDNCPFCTAEMEPVSIKKQNDIISKVFKKSALAAASSVLEYLQKGLALGFINADSEQRLRRLIGDSTKADDLYAELSHLATETDYLSKKIAAICSFRPMNVTKEELDAIEAKLSDMAIDKDTISKYYDTEKMSAFTQTLSEKIDRLKKEASFLKGLFKQHEDRLDKLIRNRKADINQFFALAGFPYRFELKKSGENQAETYLIPAQAEGTRVKEPQKHLSWGERNAFALVMFMFDAISQSPDLIVLDDPISSFDENKKFAVIRRLFDNDEQKGSFRNKTVLMLTHDFQPIIDYVYEEFFKRAGLTTPVHAWYIQNNNGTITEEALDKSSICNTTELTKRVAEDAEKNLAVRIVNMRKYIELTQANCTALPVYDVLSNIVHGRPSPIYKDGSQMPEAAVQEGMAELNRYGIENSYSEIVGMLSNEALKELIDGSCDYVAIIAMRLLLERREELLPKLRKKHPAACKFIHQSNHIENDYIFQLDPFRYYDVPPYYLTELRDFFQEEGLVSA